MDEVENILKDHHGEIAAMIVEPMIQAAGGMLVFPPGYLHRIREACTRYRVLMICDEVATGFGRTGKMFACQHEQVAPDLMAVAKGITGGYLPLGATLTTQEIYDAFLGKYEEFKTFFHGHSYTGNPLGCAVALANLEVFRKERTLTRMRGCLKALHRLLRPLSTLAHVGEIRQRGYMVGLELVKDRGSREPYPMTDRVGHRVAMEARQRGLLIRPLGNVIVLMPPLVTKVNELTRMVSILHKSIRAVTET